MADTRVFWLIRDEPGPTPETAMVGTVADAVVFEDGVAVLHWRTAPAGTEIYPSEEAMRTVRERSGRSRFSEVF